ncbi:TIGR02680 family protein [Catenulispora sp. NF23]|uniref:TIGR02680 family protein n=1 Tax=Catenulispora pinistramenti TaxID=2705254 RepID=UPI001BA56C00|nr:TIGR02680 family protein [Catenulispora pinistramenti]MBS2535914.1 TIGR02680 family protein [Catenulispora pinistramenti]
MTSPTATTAAPATALPTPTRGRWQPLRAGLIDVFYYDAEEFAFHDGRLLLRGNNGTGKSKVLALTLPFLLDGELTPSRVEPDGDRAKRMEWNLLLGGKHPNDERLGYTWLEFGRLGDDGAPQFRTIGCGLKAVKGRGIADHWFFVTDRRVGPDLPLRNEHRVSYSRKALEEKVGAHAVFTTAKGYRRAVDEALFGLGTERYEALVNLLIQLRQPQLSKRPDERLLSKALTEALPPLADGLVAEIAEAFRGLQDERDALAALVEAQGAAAAFLTHYRRYAQVAAKRTAAGVRQSNSRYEQLGRDLGAATAAREAANAAFTAAETEQARLDEHQALLSAQKDALNRDPAMDTAREIERLAKSVQALAAVARTRGGDRRRAVQESESWTTRAATAHAHAASDASAVEELHRDADAAAETAGIDHTAVRIPLTAAPDPSAARQSAEALIRTRHQALSGLRALHKTSEDAARRLGAARSAADRAASTATAAAETAAEAAATVTRHGNALVGAWESWSGACSELVLGDREAALSELAGWVATLDGPNPAARQAEESGRAQSAQLNRRVADVDAARVRAEGELSTVTDEIARLDQGHHDAPPIPHTRDTSTRTDRPGAPLWKVVDFHDDVPDQDRAGLEAALEASGLLDAWMDPDGRFVTAEGDTLLAPDGPAPGRTLAAALRPAIDAEDPQSAALSAPTVATALAAISVATADSEPGHHTWVGPDGRYRLGTLRGAWHKESAHYIGDGAREAARRTRLAELAEHAALLDSRISTLRDESQAITRRLDTVAEELRSHPSDAALREAHTRAATYADAARTAAAFQDECSAAVRTAADVATEAAASVLAFAEDTRLPADPSALDVVAEALADYRNVLSGLWPALTASSRSTAEAADAETERRRAAARLAESDEAELLARQEAEGAAEEHRTLLETSGAAVEELHRRLAGVNVALQTTAATLTTVRAHREQALKERERAEGRRLQLDEDIAAASAVRDEALAALRRFAATGLLATALPDLQQPGTAQTWVPGPAVALARAVDAALSALDDADAAWERVQQRVSREQQALSGALARHGHQVGMTLQDGLMVVDVVFAGRAQDVPTLTAALDAEVAQRTRLLSAKERELLENHLVGEVAGALQELITEAEVTVRAMNDDLAARPTSTGMALRLVWRTAKGAPEGLEAVRTRLLRKVVDAWSPADRAAVGEFLQRRIADDRAANPADTWHDQLTRAFDYRAWHEFGIQRRQDGSWVSAAGPASGGERVLAASVPLFAAASSHYSSGHPQAPRLIALDEAFAGVDDDSRAKCLGLLAAFDLDVVMTSEREWACYPTVPGIGIAQLARSEGVDAVLVTPWRWDGRDRVRLTRPEPYLPPQRSRATATSGELEPTLFDA